MTKQYSTDKIKLNFDNSTFLDGRDKIKNLITFELFWEERESIFSYNEKGENKIFKDSNHELYSDQWEKYAIRVQIVAIPKKMAKVFLKQNIDFQPIWQVLNIRKKESKQWKVLLQDLHTNWFSEIIFKIHQTDQNDLF